LTESLWGGHALDARPSAALHLLKPVSQAPILVVGGAGYIGSILGRDLIEAGHEVVVLDSLLYGAESIKPLLGNRGFRLHVGDTRDETVVRRALDGCSAVIHLGEIVGDPACNIDPSVTVSVNYTATTRLAQLAVEAGVERFIYPSSCSVYGASEGIVDEDGPLNPVSLYGRLKEQAETAILDLRSDSFHPTVFRLATVYGLSPRPRFDLVVNTLAGRAASDGRIAIQGGGQWRPFVHVADVARLLRQTLEAPLQQISGQVFNLGSDAQNHTITAVGDMVAALMPSVALEVSDGLDRRNYRVAFGKVADVLAFRPRRTVREGIAEIIEAVQSGQIADVQNPHYSNVRALLETDARQRMWREDIAGVDAASPFRPRDIETRRPRYDRQEVPEEAVS
jgi:nucleoside-diphosphate-sugar epimerase